MCAIALACWKFMPLSGFADIHTYVQHTLGVPTKMICRSLKQYSDTCVWNWTISIEVGIHDHSFDCTMRQFYWFQVINGRDIFSLCLYTKLDWWSSVIPRHVGQTFDLPLQKNINSEAEGRITVVKVNLERWNEWPRSFRSKRIVCRSPVEFCGCPARMIW
jgi:hypothetical protein